jgi:type VI secretion system secreted protein Hcp
LLIKGSKSGFISSGVASQESIGTDYRTELVDQILIQNFCHQIIVPRDVQTGLRSGRPAVHKPLMIRKLVDKSSPLIMGALNSSETLLECELVWYRPSPQTGADEPYYAIALEEATVVDVQTTNDPRSDNFSHVEDVYFAYQRITWTHLGANTQVSYDLRTAKLS